MKHFRKWLLVAICASLCLMPCTAQAFSLFDQFTTPEPYTPHSVFEDDNNEEQTAEDETARESGIFNHFQTAVPTATPAPTEIPEPLASGLAPTYTTLKKVDPDKTEQSSLNGSSGAMLTYKNVSQDDYASFMSYLNGYGFTCTVQGDLDIAGAEVALVKGAGMSLYAAYDEQKQMLYLMYPNGTAYDGPAPNSTDGLVDISAEPEKKRTVTTESYSDSVCPKCLGLGDCENCFGSGQCDYCSGLGSDTCTYCLGGECIACGGSGYTYIMPGFELKEVKCKYCNGGRCRRCDGTGFAKCQYCRGSGNCNYCHGNGKCSYCGGTGTR